jgi:hypothetical protein
MRFALFALLFTISTSSFSQKVFFKSGIPLTEKDMRPFYSSVAISDEKIFLQSNDYKTYAFDKKSSQISWEVYTGFKSDVPPVVANANVLIPGESYSLIVDTASGQVIDTLLYHDIAHYIVRDNILYATGLHEGGGVFAYDLKSRKILWDRYIGDGVAIKPYFEKDRIVVNAQGVSTWASLSYSTGRSLTGLDTVTTREELDPSCLREFEFRTHDGKEVSQAKAKKLFGKDYFGFQDIMRNDKFTVVLNADMVQFLVLGDKLKPVALVNTTEMDLGEEDAYVELGSIIRIDENKVWFFIGSYITVIDFVTKKLVRQINLEEWQPHSVKLWNDEIWLISSKDGQLYGLR